jgi:hypothetical protein
MAATDLRQELRNALASLQTKIHADGSKALEAQRTQAHLAELSSMRSLLGLCLLALSGEIIREDGMFMSQGHIRDCQDTVALAARELGLMRQQAESALVNPSPAVRHPSVQPALKAAVDAENKAVSDTEAAERRHSDMLQQGIETCCRELCDVLCHTLARAASTSSWEATQRMGAEAAEKSKRLVSSWLEWYSEVEPSKPRPGLVELPSQVTLLCLQDPVLGEYVRSLRECMHLRRQQARLVSVLRRLESAVQVGDACEVLRAKIVLPTEGEGAAAPLFGT